MTRKSSKSGTVHTDTSVWRRLEFFKFGRRFGPTIVDRYIFREILPPFIVAVLFWTTIFMSLVLKDIAGELFGKGIEPTKILTYLSYLIIEKLTETIPMSCLFAGIMAAGRLSGDSEITALRSAGISFPRIYIVYIFTGFLMLLLVGWMNLYYGPINSRAREDFEDWLRNYHSLSLVKAGRFLGRASMDGISKKGQDIYTEGRDGNILQNVQIREWFNAMDRNSEMVAVRDTYLPIGFGYITQIVHARTGELLSRTGADGKEEKFIRLRNGYIVELNQDQTEYQTTNFENGFMDYLIPPPVKPLGRVNVRPDNYTIFELYEFLEKMEKGGNQIDVGALMGDIPGAPAPGVGENGQTGMVITLPGLSEMQTMMFKLAVWITENHEKVGKPGGPTAEEFQQREQLVLQFQLFLRDAGKTKKKFEVEIQKRYAMPVACLLFFFVSFPLGLVVKRSGKGMSFSLALVIFAIYYAFLYYGLGRADKGSMDPVLGAWLGNIVIGILGFWIMSTRTDGFSPFSVLLRPFRRPAKAVWNFLGRHIPLDRWVTRIPVPAFLSRIYGKIRVKLPF